MGIIETTIALNGGTWKVQRLGEKVQIIDEKGRQRHASIGHDSTATFLAMRLAELPFESTPNYDAAAQELAKRFFGAAPQRITATNQGTWNREE